MCCRYWADESPEIREIAEQMNNSPLLKRWPEPQRIRRFGEVRPGDTAAVIAPDRRGKQAVFPMKWGFPGKNLLLNARSETAAVRPAFRESWEKRRCAVPASWYFEWEHVTGPDGKKRTGDKFLLWPRGERLTWLCGMYRAEEGLPVFVILTREPGERLRFLHDRMPLILPERLVSKWIRPDAHPEDFLESAITEMDFERVI